MVRRKNNITTENENLEQQLEGQIPEYVEETPECVESAEKVQKLSFDPNNMHKVDDEAFGKFMEKAKLGSLGANIKRTSEIRDGWIPIDRSLLGDRSIFYPEDWKFKIKPASVEAIRNWSLIDENNGNSIDDVFTEILKYCVNITSSDGNIPYGNINTWDRFFFVLLAREYTFIDGENKVEYYEDCPNCSSEVKYSLTSDSLMFDLPDDDVYKYYDKENKCWIIDPADFGVAEYTPVTFYLPTIEKDANIKQWMINQYQENNKINFDPVFIKFLPWLVNKISKDYNIAKTQIKKAELIFKSWNTNMFSLMDEVLRNIVVTPSTDIMGVCESCGEEATARMKFPDGISSLFNVVGKHSKFGSK